jgi:hypothetical protein
MNSHVENSLVKVRQMFESAALHIEALKPGAKRLPSTVLADQIAKEHGMTRAQVYPVLLLLLEGYPNIARHNGRNGGIEKIDPATAVKETESSEETPNQ